jgi:hypothetical protein
VVADLGVPESAFASTDLVVTATAVETAAGVTRRVGSIAEVIDGDDGVRFASLYATEDGRQDGDADGPGSVTGGSEGEGERPRLAPTGRIDRGSSRLVADLVAPGESYADLRTVLAERERTLRTLAERGRTSPAALASAYRDRARGRDAVGVGDE